MINTFLCAFGATGLSSPSNVSINSCAKPGFSFKHSSKTNAELDLSCTSKSPLHTKAAILSFNAKIYKI